MRSAVPVLAHGLVVAGMSILVACGGDGGGGTAPTPPSSATATGLTITGGADTLLIGESTTFSTTATFSDGTSRSVASTWSSDNAAVVAVDGSGRATAQGAGMATLTASAEGRIATRTVRGLPDFGGNWSLQVRELACDVPGRWGGGFCNVSGLYTMSLRLTRSGDQVTGTLDNGIGWTGAVSGQVSVDGTLALTGRISSFRPNNVTFHSDLSQWQTRLSSSAGMTGTFREILTWVGESSQGFISNEVVGGTK